MAWLHGAPDNKPRINHIKFHLPTILYGTEAVRLLANQGWAHHDLAPYTHADIKSWGKRLSYWQLNTMVIMSRMYSIKRRDSDDVSSKPPYQIENNQTKLERLDSLFR